MNVIGTTAPETQRVRREDVVNGITIYVANPQPAGGNWHVSTRVIDGDVFFNHTGTPFVHYRTQYGHRSEMSLRDAGIIPNTYNFHAAFFCEDEAKAYAERISRYEFTPFELRMFAPLLERRSFSFTKK